MWLLGVNKNSLPGKFRVESWEELKHNSAPVCARKSSTTSPYEHLRPCRWRYLKTGDLKVLWVSFKRSLSRELFYANEAGKQPPHLSDEIRLQRVRCGNPLCRRRNTFPYVGLHINTGELFWTQHINRIMEFSLCLERNALGSMYDLQFHCGLLIVMMQSNTSSLSPGNFLIYRRQGKGA
jgi:hypothetical protein